MNNKIVRISVTKLFGFLEHDIELKADGVTFIHGPNGCGKTTFLKLVASLFGWDLVELNKTNFEKLVIEYSNKMYIQVTKEYVTKNIKRDNDVEKMTISQLKFSLNNANKKTKVFTVERDRLKVPASQIDEYIPYLHRIGGRAWIDSRTDEHLSYNEVLEKFSHQLPFSSSNRRPEWLHDLQTDAKLHFVQTQRLLKVSQERLTHRSEGHVTNVIEIYSKELQRTISNQLAESAAVSQSKDRSFPQRLLSMSLDKDLSEEQIRLDYEETEKKIKKLMDSGLVEQDKSISLPNKMFEATEKKVLTLYLQDINEKYLVFDELLLKIETFLSIVSPKLRNKTFKVSQKDGFLINTIQGRKQTLKPHMLSSGEQHQIVLFYELIFKTSDNSFLLIDEPEISLHIDWQRQFLSDISKIAKIGQHSFLIATHSPQIIGNRRDLAESLDGGILND